MKILREVKGLPEPDETKKVNKEERISMNEGFTLNGTAVISSDELKTVETTEETTEETEVASVDEVKENQE